MTEKNVISGDEIEFSIDVGLGELQLLLLRMYDQKVIQVDVYTQEELTAGLALNRAICLAKWMMSQGIKQGDVVSINSENRLEYCIVPLASFLIGAIFTAFNPEYTPSELNHVVNLSKSKLVFCSQDNIKTMRGIKANHKSIQKFVLFGSKRTSDTDVVMYEDIIKGVVSEPVNNEFEAVKINPKETVATILCSSGTTGWPKGVMTTHDNMTSFIEIARTRIEGVMETDSTPERVVTFGLAPFFHSMGFMLMYLNILGGNLVIVMPKFKPKLFLEAIPKYKVTNLVVPPPIILFLTKHPLAKNYDLSSLKDVRSGAAPLGKEMEKEVKEKYNLFHVSQGYGMTETTLGVLVSTHDESRVGSVGKIVPGMMVKVIDAEGNALGPNQEGELCFKGPLIMKGYVGDEDSTKHIIDQNGWLHTGDVSYYDKDGYFFIVDRIKELIKYKAFQVAPAELESLLLSHPSVLDAAVVGLPDEEAGELPLAFIVKRPGIGVTPKELQDFVASKVSRQKQLRGGVHFIEEIPKNPSGKILRRVLKIRAKSLHSKL